MKYNDQKVIERLKEKTRELIVARGVKGWSMETLAKESGIAKSTLYRIIESKEALILDIVLSDMRKFEQEYEQILANREDFNFIEKIGKFISRNVTIYFGTYLNEALLEYPTLEDQVKANEEKIKNITIMFLELVKNQNEIRKDIDSVTFFESLMGIILHFIRLGYSGEVLTYKISIGFSFIIESIKEKK